jgi:hypothetical protein
MFYLTWCWRGAPAPRATSRPAGPQGRPVNMFQHFTGRGTASAEGLRYSMSRTKGAPGGHPYQCLVVMHG